MRLDRHIYTFLGALNLNSGSVKPPKDRLKVFQRSTFIYKINLCMIKNDPFREICYYILISRISTVMDLQLPSEKYHEATPCLIKMCNS